MFQLASHLHRSRHAVFYFRLVVPRVFRTGTKRPEIRISLGTRDPREARRAALLLWFYLQSHIDTFGIAMAEGKKKTSHGHIADRVFASARCRRHQPTLPVSDKPASQGTKGTLMNREFTKVGHSGGKLTVTGATTLLASGRERLGGRLQMGRCRKGWRRKTAASPCSPHPRPASLP